MAEGMPASGGALPGQVERAVSGWPAGKSDARPRRADLCMGPLRHHSEGFRNHEEVVVEGFYMEVIDCYVCLCLLGMPGSPESTEWITWACTASTKHVATRRVSHSHSRACTSRRMAVTAASKQKSSSGTHDQSLKKRARPVTNAADWIATGAAVRATVHVTT